MNPVRHVLFALIFLSVDAFAFQPKVEIIEQFDNLKMVAFISAEEINSNPEWQPASQPPPLTVDAAINALKMIVKDPVSIVEIEIRQVPRHDRQWHYLIKVANDVMTSKYSVYVVLMSGKVIPAIIQPQGYK